MTRFSPLLLAASLFSLTAIATPPPFPDSELAGGPVREWTWNDGEVADRPAERALQDDHQPADNESKQPGRTQEAPALEDRPTVQAPRVASERRLTWASRDLP